MGEGFKQLKVWLCYKEKTVVGSKFQSLEVIRDKRDGESAGSISFQFDSEGLLCVLKPRISRIERFRGDN